MARLTVAACFGVLVGLGLGAALGIRAEPDEVLAAAEEAGVAPELLEGAMSSTGLGPREYLAAVGEEKGPVRTAAPPAPAAYPPPSIWTRLADCESTGRWHIATGNGYFGGLQQDMSFWRRHGGLQYASRPDLATPMQQIAVAQVGQAVQGWAAWPACSRRLGLR